jgi:hypothetical protein
MSRPDVEGQIAEVEAKLSAEEGWAYEFRKD